MTTPLTLIEIQLRFEFESSEESIFWQLFVAPFATVKNSRTSELESARKGQLVICTRVLIVFLS